MSGTMLGGLLGVGAMAQEVGSGGDRTGFESQLCLTSILIWGPGSLVPVRKWRLDAHLAGVVASCPGHTQVRAGPQLPLMGSRALCGVVGASYSGGCGTL